MRDAADAACMQRALELAAKGRGLTSPNPMVGAVLVKGRRVIGEGYHHAAGRDHAEVVAIKKAGRRARGATLYVTLEPCCHTGSTGPCTEAIVSAGIKRVVYAAKDPNPAVNGKGARTLHRAGIDIKGGVLGHQARRLNEQFFGYHRNGRPFITLKCAQSLDGRIATVTGDSQWITNLRSRRLAHQLRNDVDAVLVGSGTLRHDDPALTVRHVKGVNPYRIVVTSDMKLPRDRQLFKNNGDGRTIVATASRTEKKKLSNGQLIYWQLKRTRQGQVEVSDLVRQAGLFGLRSLLVEGGAQLVTSFLKAGLFDKLVIVIAPVIIGRGVDSIGELTIRSLADAVRFERYTFDSSNGDCIFIGYPKRKV